MFKKFLIGTLAVVAFVVTSNLALASYDFGSAILKVGSRGQYVTTLQNLVGSTPVDGVFGPKTKAKVVAWQVTNGLTADGLFGNLSKAKANETGTNFGAGCTNASGFSTTTGFACSNLNAHTFSAGCTNASGFSTTTGLNCLNNLPPIRGGGSIGGHHTATLSSDATLILDSEVKGVKFTNTYPAGCDSNEGISEETGVSCDYEIGLGTPSETLAGSLATPGFLLLTNEQAIDETDANNFVTLFQANNLEAVVTKVVQYDYLNFDTSDFETTDDVAYDGHDPLPNGGIFIVKVTAEDNSSVLYYAINVQVIAEGSAEARTYTPNTITYTLAAGTFDAVQGDVIANWTLLGDDVADLGDITNVVISGDNNEIATITISGDVVFENHYAIIPVGTEMALSPGFYIPAPVDVIVVASNDASVTAGTWTVSSLVAGVGTITNVPFGTPLDAFLGDLTPAGGAGHGVTWSASNVNNPVQSGNYLVVTAEDRVTTATYNITVNPVVSATLETPKQFDLYASASDDVTSAVTLHDATSITGITNVATPLTLTTDYTFAAGTLTINESYLDSLSPIEGEDIVLTVNFNVGGPAELIINVVDNTPVVPVIATTSTIASGKINPSIVVTLTGDTFTGSSDQVGNWTVDYGNTNLAITSIVDTTTQVTLNFSGTATPGTINLTAKTTALTGGVASNPISIIIPAAVYNPATSVVYTISNATTIIHITLGNGSFRADGGDAIDKNDFNFAGTNAIAIAANGIFTRTSDQMVTITELSTHLVGAGDDTVTVLGATQASQVTTVTGTIE